MIELKKKQELTNLAIIKLEKRIKDLESLTSKLNDRVAEENIKRNELNTFQSNYSENNNSQIKTIKESIEQLATIFNNSLIEPNIFDFPSFPLAMVVSMLYLPVLLRNTMT